MYLRHRYHRGSSVFVQPSPYPRLIKTLVMLGIILFLVYWIGSWILRLFGVGNALDRAAAELFVEERGSVQISLQGEEPQTAENGMSLFPGDSLHTGARSQATLRFFDGSVALLDERTQLLIDESARGEEESRLSLALEEGSFWIQVPATQSATGSIARTVEAGEFTLVLPVDTKALLQGNSFAVFSAAGNGVEVIAPKTTFWIGEGQRWTLPPDGKIGDDPLVLRSAIEPALYENPFVKTALALREDGKPVPAHTSDDILTVTDPSEGFTFRGILLAVKGKVNDQVARVLVNDRPAELNEDTHSFSQDVSIPEGERQIEVQVKAIGEDGTVLDTVRRIVQRADTAEVALPTITSPAKTGETYRTNQAELVIRGTSPAGAAGMMVNDYRLQLFSPAKGEWSYLASLALGNMKAGTNTYDVRAVAADGTKSDPVRITIIAGEDTNGVVTSSSSSSASSAVAEPPLLTNDPLTPGILSVTAPTAGTAHTETGTGFLLEGKTSAETSSMWINDYRLQLYTRGKTFWNYIASEDFGNLKKGTNVYVIVARNDKGEILDRMEYTVSYEPKE